MIELKVIKRDRTVADFTAEKIRVAVQKAYIAVRGTEEASTESGRASIQNVLNTILERLEKQYAPGTPVDIESIQDKVEIALMANGLHDVARAYILYREEHKKQRKIIQQEQGETVQVEFEDGVHAVGVNTLSALMKPFANGLNRVNVAKLAEEVMRTMYNGIKQGDMYRAMVLAGRAFIEYESQYSKFIARVVRQDLHLQATGHFNEQSLIQYDGYFQKYIHEAIAAEILNPELATFDLDFLAKQMKAERDDQFEYLGMTTLIDRYFIHIDGRRVELPQAFFMRVAMGISLAEKPEERNQRAVEFYNVLSSFDYMTSTPTLFNSGTMHSQLSSCYLTTIADDLDGIYEGLKEDALLSKFAGGIGNDWTSVRSMGAHIKGTNGKSQGVVPFLKVANDTAVAVNQGGKRKGAICAYLETWHADIEEFLELRKNTGDDRRRTHDMNTANWIPDLFMERVMSGADWSLFSPNEVPELHDLYGNDFRVKYEEYEALGKSGKLRVYKSVPALTLWRKMLTMLFETGHPWINFKDPCNLRSPQQHAGVVHSSNLCTEITLNTNEKEIAVCNLGSVNLVQHVRADGSIDKEKIARTIKTAVRMLDNVIDVNFYPVKKAEYSNKQHRPVGLGMMGLQEVLYIKKVPFESAEAIQFNDELMELIAYHAYLGSSELAAERGAYPSYDGSLWSKGILPQDSLQFIANNRASAEFAQLPEVKERLDWSVVRKSIAQYGMRNSNVIAIAPTATISNIIGVSASFEPQYQNLFVKSNLSGEFTIVNEYLMNDLRALGLYDDAMIADLKYFEGSVQNIERVPQHLKDLYKTSFEMDPIAFVEGAARRQIWIDQAQSLNIYMAGASGKKIDALYKHAWLRGLKTTYYLRTLGASSAEKSTGRGGELNAVQAQPIAKPVAPVESVPATDVKFCSIDNPDCESCQ